MRPKYESIQSSAESSPYDSDTSRVSGNVTSDVELGNNAAPQANTNDTVAPYQFRRWCGVRRSTCLLLIYICSYFAYLLGGAYLMVWLEADTEKSLRDDAIKYKSDFMLKHPSINGSELEEFLDFVIRTSQQGISVLDNDAYEKNWSLGQSFLFTVTVVTTIGYGHITPITQVGKLVCVFYAVLGIPFTLVFLSAMVQRLLYPTCSLLSLLFASRIANRISPFNIRLIHLTFLALIFSVFFVLIPAAIFANLETGWTYLDAFYFVFISLTTIGLGDYTPGSSNDSIFVRDIYQACVAGYLLLGLVFMTLTLTVFYDIPQLNLGLHLHKHMDIHIGDDRNPDEQQSERFAGIRRRFSFKSFFRRNSFFKSNENNCDSDEQTALTTTGS